ncbi:MAG: RluA family pseudouridine synthase [Treponemataceae bacterium]|nr:RluA family pseudouridine synthase [Treponemataceae bacterium]
MKKNSQSRIQILYQDKNLAVIFKPENLLSVPYEGCRAKTALDLLEQIMRKNGTYSAKHKPFAVHRLDRDTSGVMMFALNENSKKIIMDGWQKIVTARTYRAVAENPKNPRAALPESGTISKPLAYNAYNLAFVPKEGENFKTVSAITDYKILRRGKNYALFELNLNTGRKNQIRAHLANAGYPLAGDKNYRAKTNPFGRLALHARLLEFEHPFTKEKLRFEIPEPENWKKFVEGNTAVSSPAANIGKKSRADF